MGYNPEFPLMNKQQHTNRGQNEEFNRVLYLVRHGSTNLNRESGSGKDIIRGHIDVPLAESGRREAIAAADRLERCGIQLIATSDLSRAVETAEIIAARSNAVVTAFYGLRPWKLGPAIEGHDYEEVLPRIRHFFQRPDETPQGGESFRHFKGRVFHTVAGIKVRGAYTKIAIVTHFRCIRLFESRKGRNDVDTGRFFGDGGPPCSIRLLCRGKVRAFGDEE